MSVRFIEAKEIKLQNMLSNANEAYKVPVYQRPYAWTKTQWEDLFEDIMYLEDDKIHFLGSIVVVPEEKHRMGVNYFQVVDGQQRLTTLLIWLSVIRDIAKENNDEELAKHLTETFLFAKEWEGGKQILIPKLRLSKLDDEPFQKILEGKPKDGKHSVFECYKYFKEKTTDINLWQKLLNNISFVHINTFNHFNAFKLFETLNDRGLELSAADLIKNFVLMKISSVDENTFDSIIDEWTEMYEKVRDYEPVKFIRRYVLSNWKGPVSEKRLYESVRSKLEDVKSEEICNFVKSLNSSATIYKKIVECSLSSEKLNKKLNELHLVEVAPSFTLLLKILPYFEGGNISEEDVLDVMDMIEVFHIRWGICGQSTSRLDQIYNEICMELQDKSPSEFKTVIRQKFFQEIKNNVDDEIFKRNFSSRSFKPNESRTKYILWKLSKPTGETLINIKEIQTEHIMPRTLNSKWVEYFKRLTSKSKEEILALHKEYLDRIGNLTIIKGEWNISMSNRLFSEKKNDYAKSEFKITKDLMTYEKWTFDEIEDRTRHMTEEALKIWGWKW